MLSVLHVLSSLHLGGAERFTIDLAYLQCKHDVKAQILSLGSDDEVLVAEVLRNNIPLSLCPFSDGRIRNYRTIAQLFSAVDVVHIHSPYALKFLSPLILLFPFKKYVYTRHGLAPLNLLSWRILHQLLRPFIARVTFVTSAGLDVFRQNHRWNHARLKVVENGVLIPDEVRNEVVSQSDPIRLGAVGRLVELKGHRILLKTFDLVSDSAQTNPQLHTCELNIYGSGPLENELRDIASISSHGNMITFHGTILDREAVYENIDILIVCSETEGLSMVIIEAMARGIPVIATDVGGNPILVHSGENGFLVPYNDIEKLRIAIEHLLGNQEDILRFGEQGRAMIASKFSLLNTHLSYMECYGAVDQ